MPRVIPGRALFVVAYMVGIAFFSSLSRAELAELGIPPRLAEIGHVPLFAGLAAVALWSLVGPPGRRVLLALLLCLVFALADEWHQKFVPGRVQSLADVVADGIGIIIGIAVAVLLPLGWRALRPRGRIPRGGLQQ